MYCIRWTYCLRYLNCNNLEVRCRGRRTFSQKCRMAASYTIRECKQMNSKKKKWKKSTRTKRPECCFGFVCDRVRRLFSNCIDLMASTGCFSGRFRDRFRLMADDSSRLENELLSVVSIKPVVVVWKGEKERAISDRNRLLIAAEEEAVGVCQSFCQATT